MADLRYALFRAFDEATKALRIKAPELAPSVLYEAVAPDDATGFSFACRALYVGNGGDVAVVRTDDVVVLFKNVSDGQRLDIVATRVNATDTTAADMVALL